jgi:pimeloyl-ACP methyl ester carboxylesterase
MDESLNRSVRLPDRRTLSYAEYGVPGGRAVVWMHGLPGSRLDWSIGNGPALLEELELRVIAPDRPGFGRSTPHRGRTHASFAEDLDVLMQSLGVVTATLLGYSGGAPYALAAAQARTGGLEADGVVLVSPIGPRSTPRFGDGLGRTDKVMLLLSRVPPVARLAMRSSIRDARTRPDMLLNTLRKDFSTSASDLRLLDEPDTADRVLTAFREATAQGAGGCVSDWALWGRKWSFDGHDGRTPVHIWHGSDDPLVPLHHAQHLQHLCGGARLDVWDGGGHLHGDDAWRQVLSALG